jgi:C-terminal processing protease CtpA/Prc
MRQNTRPFRALSTLALSLSLSLLAACGGGGSGGTDGGTSACGEAARKDWVLGATREWYLFPETLPTSVNVASYASAEELLDALTASARAQGKDRFFSYLTTRAAEDSLLGEGQFIGFGFRNRTDDGNRPFVLDVFDASPASEAGLQRGDEVVAVNQGSGFVPVSQLLANGDTFADLLGPPDVGIQRGLRLQRNGVTFEVQLTKRTVTIDPVVLVSTLPMAGTTGVGYLHLRSYISTADPQLRDAFAQFRAQDVRDFIVDLRYNGGGLVSTAELINNLLGGDLTTQDVQFQVLYNTAKSAQNSTARFQPQPQSTRPVRIAFLTTDATASASEININSMRPYVEAAIVGSDTFGKPVGQVAFDLASSCQDRLRLVTFRTVNALGEGDYYDGIASSMSFACAASDTLGAPMNDAGDGLTGAALSWLGTGACGSVIGAVPAGARLKSSADSRMPMSRQPSVAERWLPGIA